MRAQKRSLWQRKRNKEKRPQAEPVVSPTKQGLWHRLKEVGSRPMFGGAPKKSKAPAPSAAPPGPEIEITASAPPAPEAEAATAPPALEVEPASAAPSSPESPPTSAAPPAPEVEAANPPPTLEVKPAGAAPSAPEAPPTVVAPPAPEAAPSKRELWGRQFDITSQGLAEHQVQALVDELRGKVRHLEQELKQQQEQSPRLNDYVQKVMGEVHQMEEKIRERAVSEARAQSAEIVGKAKQQARELVSDARKEARRSATLQVEELLREGRSKVSQIEAEALFKAHSHAVEERDRAGGELQQESAVVFHRLMVILQSLAEESENIQDEWNRKTIDIREGTYTQVEQEGTPLGGAAGVAADVVAEMFAREETGDPESPSVEESSSELLAGAVASDLVAETLTGEEASAPELVPAEEISPEISVDSTAVEEETVLAQEGTPSDEREGPAAEVSAEEEVEVVMASGEIAAAASAEEKVEEPGAIDLTAISSAAAPIPTRDHYSGEIELSILPPVDAAMLAQLYKSLTAQSELRILSSVGSWDRGTTITVQTDRALPLLEILGAVPGAVASPVAIGGSRRNAGGVGGGPSSGVERIEVRMKEEEEVKEEEAS